jgi:hypothetical protein
MEVLIPIHVLKVYQAVRLIGPEIGTDPPLGVGRQAPGRTRLASRKGAYPDLKDVPVIRSDISQMLPSRRHLGAEAFRVPEENLSRD